MTAPSTTSTVHGETDAVPTGRVFGRTCAAEWTRLWTVKSTWWFLATAAVIMVGLGAIAGFDAAGDAEGDAAWRAAEFTAIPAQFALLALALTAVTSDYATGGIVPALQWTPRRAVLFLARAIVVVGAATSLGVLLGLASCLAAFAAARPALDLPFREGIGVLSTVAFVFGAGTALAVGLGFLLRSTAGALVAVFLLLLLLPALLPQFGYEWLTAVADRLPGVGALFLLTAEPNDRGITETSAALSMLVWAVSTLLLGRLRLMRDDADR